MRDAIVNLILFIFAFIVSTILAIPLLILKYGVHLLAIFIVYKIVMRFYAGG